MIKQDCYKYVQIKYFKNINIFKINIPKHRY